MPHVEYDALDNNPHGNSELLRLHLDIKNQVLLTVTLK